MGHKLKTSKHSHSFNHSHVHCRGKQGPPGPMGPPGPTTISSVTSVIPFEPSIISRQTKNLGPIIIKEDSKIAGTITIDIPTGWKTYDLIISAELFADEIDTHSGVVMSIREGHTVNGKIIGSQVLGYNGIDYHSGIGFSGYHKEILNDKSDNGPIQFCLTVETVDTIDSRVSDTTVINIYIHLQAIRQS